jgi:hypothetical protein
MVGVIVDEPDWFDVYPVAIRVFARIVSFGVVLLSGRGKGAQKWAAGMPP